MSEILPNREWEQLIAAQDETGFIEVDWRNGAVRMCDLVTKEPLEAGEIPASMREKEYGEGFVNFRRLAEEYNVKIELILNNHGGLQDHDRLLEDHEETLRTATLACIEMNTLHENAHKLPLEEALLPGFKGASEGHIKYTKAQLSTLEAFNTLALPIDIDVSPVGKVQMAFVEACDEAEGRSPEVDLAFYGAYQNSRQYAFLAKIGMWLAQIETQQPHVLDKDVSIALMLGSYHVAVADKIQSLGVEVNTPETRDQLENEDDPGFAAFLQMTRNAKIDFDTLKKGAAAATR